MMTYEEVFYGGIYMYLQFQWKCISISRRGHMKLKVSTVFPIIVELFSGGHKTNFDRVVFLQCVSISLNPFMPSGLFYLKSLDRSISNRRGVWVVFIITIFFRNSYILCKQCWPWSDAAFCGVWSGSTVFANVSFYGTLGINGSIGVVLELSYRSVLILQTLYTA